MEPLEYKELFSSSYPEDLEPIAKLLSTYKIDFIIEAGAAEFNPFFTMQRTPDATKLLVREDEFALARDILTKMNLIADVSEVDGYREMLGGLEDDDLKEMVVNAVEYPAEEVAMAKAILAERGVNVEESQIAEERSSYAVVERKPRNMKLAGKVIWTLISLLIPPAGLAVSLVVLFLRNRDAEGNSYSYYNRSTRILAWVNLGTSGAISFALLYLNFRTAQIQYDSFFW